MRPRATCVVDRAPTFVDTEHRWPTADQPWARTIFVIGTLVTVGLLGLVYLALAFIVPIEARAAPHP